MNINTVDLNLLIYLNALLEERSVTRAAEKLSITQPAMSNALKRLRETLNDPILVRTSTGMTPTEKALRLEPLVTKAILAGEAALQPEENFDPKSCEKTFRIMATDYIEATLLTHVMLKIKDQAPNASIDVMTPSDVSFRDIEDGRVDLAINRFDQLPDSFHQMPVWQDSFSCVLHKDNTAADDLDLEKFLAAEHVWVSKTGMGVGTGMRKNIGAKKLGWVDNALNNIGKERTIRVFTRHYMVASLLAEQRNLIATMPTRAANLFAQGPNLACKEVPFEIPDIQVTMAWSPLLQSNAGHQWLRRLVSDVAKEISQS